MTKLPPLGPRSSSTPQGPSVADQRVFPQHAPKAPQAPARQVDHFVRTPPTTVGVLVGRAVNTAELRDPTSVARNLRHSLNALEPAIRRSGLTEQKGEVLRLNAAINRLNSYGGTVGDAQAISASIAGLRASLSKAP